MAKITKAQELHLTRAEAVALIKNADGKVRFQFRVSALLPIQGEDDKCFEGVTFLSVSKAQAVELVLGLLSETLEKRGARISLRTDPPKSKGDLAFISIY